MIFTKNGHRGQFSLDMLKKKGGELQADIALYNVIIIITE